jgi:hypothetical protein
LGQYNVAPDVVRNIFFNFKGLGSVHGSGVSKFFVFGRSN